MHELPWGRWQIGNNRREGGGGHIVCLFDYIHTYIDTLTFAGKNRYKLEKERAQQIAERFSHNHIQKTKQKHRKTNQLRRKKHRKRQNYWKQNPCELRQ